MRIFLCRPRRPIAVVLLSVVAVTFGGEAESANRNESVAALPELSKVSSHLLRARGLGAAGWPHAVIERAEPLVRLDDGLAHVEVRLEALDAEILAALRARGLRIESLHLGPALVYGRLPLAALAGVATITEVSTIQPMPRSGTRAGSVLNQADVTMRSNDARSMFGVDGSGVTVGLLSDSFNTGLGGSVSAGVCTCAVPGSTCGTVVTGMTNQVSGDLPPSLPILDDCTAGAPNCSSLSDEGAALGELLFDVAPGTTFMFHSAFNSPADFAAGISELVNCGADVIVDDVFWTFQPYFQDGEIAQAAQAAVDAGVPYFSAAGNDASFGVHDSFVDFDHALDDQSFPPSGHDLHDFGGGDRFAAITLPASCSVDVELQWSEPFDGTLGPGASSDLDLYLLSSAAVPVPGGGGNVLALSTTQTGCGASGGLPSGSPVEAVSYTNTTGGLETIFVAVEHFCGNQAADMRIVTISFDCATTGAGWSFEAPIFVDSQIFGHPAAEGVVAVGATFYGEIDTGGAVDPPFGGQLDVEPFSSLGGFLPFYFDAGGTPLGPSPIPGGIPGGTPPPPRLRYKPEITAPDGTNTTFFGSDVGFDPDVDPNFFGTSAAAPHAAAIAVLMRDLTDNGIAPSALRQILEQSAFDMETPGFDGLSGFGFADALKSVGSLQDPFGTGFIDNLAFDLDGGDFVVPGFVGAIKVRAIDTLTLGNGDYSGVFGLADTIIFANGFGSAGESTWSN